MAELNKDIKINNIVAVGTLGYKVDMIRYQMDQGAKPADFVKKSTPLRNKVELDGVKILLFSSGKVVLYGNSYEQINKRWELVRAFAEKYKVI